MQSNLINVDGTILEAEVQVEDDETPRLPPLPCLNEDEHLSIQSHKKINFEQTSPTGTFLHGYAQVYLAKNFGVIWEVMPIHSTGEDQGEKLLHELWSWTENYLRRTTDSERIITTHKDPIYDTKSPSFIDEENWTEGYQSYLESRGYERKENPPRLELTEA